MDLTRAAQGQDVKQRSRVRYWILFLLFITTTLNYADRATLSVTGTAIRSEFGFDAIRMGYIFSAFSWAYVLCQLPSGWLLDRFGARRMYSLSIFFWSVFTLVQGGIGLVGHLASAVVAFFVLRFAVGMAEAPAFPSNAKIVSSWFPVSERGTASAIFNSAQYFAPVIFTPLMAWITHSFGWEGVYLTMGVLGIGLAAFFLKSMKQPDEHPGVNAAELEHIRGTVADLTTMPAADGRIAKVGSATLIKRLLTNRMFIGIYLAQYCVNVLTYFFLTWFPIYLMQARGMTILKAGVVASLPAICGFLGGVLGGVISDALLRRGVSLTAARKIPIVSGMLLSTCIIGCNYVEADWIVVLLMSISFFGKGIGALGWAVVADTSPKSAVGLSGALFNMFGNVAGIVTPIVIGYLVAENKSFNGALVFVGINALMTMICYLVIVKEIRRVDMSELERP
jgi:D-galactonate transporter